MIPQADEIARSFSYHCRHDPPLHFHAVTFGSMKYCLNHCCSVKGFGLYLCVPSSDALISFQRRQSEAANCQCNPNLPSAAFRGPVQSVAFLKVSTDLTKTHYSARFIVDDPGRQMAGSFNPIYSNSDDWECSAYEADNDRNGDEEDD